MTIPCPKTEIIKTKIDNNVMKVKKILLHSSYKFRCNDIGETGRRQILRLSKYTGTFNRHAIIAALRTIQ